MVTIVERKNRREAIKHCLEHIKDRRGIVRPSKVVDAAEDPGHPLHSEFEWDNEVAGPQFRLHQARQLIRQYTIEIVDDPDKPAKKMRGFVSLLRDRNAAGGYRQTSDIIKQEDLMKELESTFKHELDSLLTRYEVLREICAEVRRAAKLKK